MGRCYEFGVSIDPSSELAMVVAPGGGHCECPATGVTCAGRFAACASVVARPGYVPAAAPAWALARRPAPVAASGSAPTRSTVAVAPPRPHWPTPADRTSAASVDAPDAPAAPAVLDLTDPPSPPQPPDPRPNPAELVDVLGRLSVELAAMCDRPPAATVEDLAEAVIAVRRELVARVAPDEANIAHTVATTVATTVAETVEQTVVRAVDGTVSVAVGVIEGRMSELDRAVDALPAVLSSRDEAIADAVSELAELIAPVAERVDRSLDELGGRLVDDVVQQLTTRVRAIVQDELAGVEPPDLASIERPLNAVGRAVVTLRDAQGALVDELQRTRREHAEALARVQADIASAEDRHARELHLLREQIEHAARRDEERRAGEVGGDELARELRTLRAEVARLAPEADGVVTATQLAETVNTLRGAGVEEISSAHLVHALQVEMAQLRHLVTEALGRDGGPGGGSPTAPTRRGD